MDSRIYSSNMQIVKAFSNIQRKLANNLENLSYKSIFDGGEGCKSRGFSKNFGGNKETASDKFDKESDGGFWSSKRLLKKKMQMEIEQIIHKKRMMIQEINEEVALTREIKMKQSIMENAPELPITGVPAKYLLANLPSLPTVSV